MNLKRIWHVGAWNRNIGDWTAGYNLHRMLEEQAAKRDMALSFYLVDSQRGMFHDAMIQQMNDEADLVILGAGGMIFNREQDQSVSQWAFNITIERMKQIEVPIVVYGIGYNQFYFDKTPWSEYTGRHLRALQDMAKIFSVRNEGSRNMLSKELGLDIEDIEIIPDPGMRLFDRKIEIPGLSRKGPVIGINWAGDRPHERFPQPWKETRTYFIDTLRKTLIKLVKEKDAQILFVPHLEDVDPGVFSDLSLGFPEGSIINIKEVLPYLYPPAGEILYYNVPFMTNIYRQLDLMLGMRGHACIFSFGAGTKFIPIGSHNKVRYFAEDVGVPDYAIKMVNPEIETSDYMYDKITGCLNDKDYDRVLPELQKKQFSLLDNANERVLDLIRR